MGKKIVFLFLISFFLLFSISFAKYCSKKEIFVAKINIDTIIPKIELMNIKNILYKEEDKEFYDVNIQIKVIETNLKENNLNKNKINIKIDEKEIKNYEIIQINKTSNEIIYEIKINKFLKKQKIHVLIPEGSIIDNSNNRSEEKNINYEIN